MPRYGKCGVGVCAPAMGAPCCAPRGPVSGPPGCSPSCGGFEAAPAPPACWEGGVHLAVSSPSALPPRGLPKRVGFFILELTIPAVRSADALSSGELPSGGPLASDVACSFGGRSEEHTSELQSLMRISYAVFC